MIYECYWILCNQLERELPAGTFLSNVAAWCVLKGLTFVWLTCYKTFPVRSVQYNLGIWEFSISSAKGNSPAVEREDTESDWCWGCHGDGSYGMVAARRSRRESSLSVNQFWHKTKRFESVVNFSEGASLSVWNCLHKILHKKLGWVRTTTSILVYLYVWNILWKILNTIRNVLLTIK